MSIHYNHPRYGPQKALRDDLLPTELAWFAGFVDGEGCLGIYENKGERFLGQLIVTNTDPLPIETIKGFYKCGVDFRVNKRNYKNAVNWRPLYTINIPQRFLLETLSALLPYLRNKKTQASIMMNYLVTRYTGEYPLNHKVFRDYAQDISVEKVA